ncbi:BTAD domain-containing putative transcriptional regulator [Pseudonocardia sp. TRM90224]|uniref:BTAD domain-containing putative transcriptional regulator n=1 Tax=Pseudonocardia sp. TRM90224 TaxID=2812678 RepID=UPI001E5A819F|nr:BTAD domain-containing putative transcriptional regulator [Pseudonocardia sp. TRM90224]
MQADVGAEPPLRVRVGLLGTLVLDTGAGPVAVSGARLRALLARLALDAGRAVRPEVLVGALWEEAAPPADEANALQSLVSRLRRILGDPALLTSDPAGYRLAADVDTARFEALARSGRQLLARGSTAEAAATLREALALWRGPALADVREAPFIDAEIERLERARLAALEDRIEADLVLGFPQVDPDLVEEIELLAADHPLHERLHAQLMRALAAAGRGTEALAAYQQLRDRLVEAFGSDPGPVLQSAHLAVLRGEAGGGPRPAARGNLDASLTSFVGRDDDVRQVVELLGRARLVTLVGPGGAGKTRLATTIGSRLTAPGGVWFVALAPVDAPDVHSTVLDVLRAREAGRPALPPAVDTLDRLVDLLSDDDVVLVLDNCEHVIDAAAAMVEKLLGRCPRLRVLTTSREPLRIGGEHLHPVPPLDPPSAIRLFAERATAVRPDFTLDSDTSTAATEICQRLDGLPLPIELAAARLRTLPIEIVAARLDDRFRLLTGGSRTALPRHRTLHAVVAWSWDLLADDERLLLERLSVVPGSFGEDAAQAIGGLDAPELLAALVDKSLLQTAETDGTDDPRYRMLETIREYGLEQLAARAETDDVRARHAAFFLELAKTADPHLRTRDQLRWLARLEAERDNLLTAFRWTIAQADADAAARFGAALSWYWSLQGNPPETLDLLDRTLALRGPADPTARAVVVAARGLNTGPHSRPDQFAADLSDVVQAINGIDGALHPLLEEVRLAAMIAAPDAMQQPFPDDPRERPDAWSRAAGLLIRGQLARITGKVDEARILLTEALNGFERLGERWGTATALSSLEPILRLSGELHGLPEMHERATRCFHELGMAEYSIENEVGAAVNRAATGDLDGGRRRLHDLLDEFASAPAEVVAPVHFGLAQLEWRAGRLEQTRDHAEEGLSEKTPPHLAALLLCLLAQVDAAEERPDDAARRLNHVAVRLMLTWDTPIAAEIAVTTAWIELSRGRPIAAVQLLGAAATLRGAGDGADLDARRIAEQTTLALDEDDFMAAHAAGAALSWAEAKDLVAAVIIGG